IAAIGRFAAPEGKHSWADVILAVLTAAYVFVTYRQWHALRETVDVQREATRVADAALVHAKAAADAQLEETRRGNNLTLGSWVIVEGFSVEGALLESRRFET